MKILKNGDGMEILKLHVLLKAQSLEQVRGREDTYMCTEWRSVTGFIQAFLLGAMRNGCSVLDRFFGGIAPFPQPTKISNP